MSFLYPSFLFALSAIAIPIIIHLFNFRKFKTVYFSNVRFLKEVKEETQAKSKIKHLLVLAARILAIMFMVFAFAQPFIPVKNSNIRVGDKVVSIFIDNSFSMDAINKNGTLLDEAKKRALEILSTFKATDRFQLLTNDFEGKHQRLLNKEEFIHLLDDVKIGPASRSISEIMSRQSDLLQQSGNTQENASGKSKISFILSDFQKSNYTLNPYNDRQKNDASIIYNFIPLTAAQQDNVYIDTCWFETPVRQFGQVEKLHVHIKNGSDKDLENNPIKLYINDVQKTPSSFNVEKDSDTEVILSFVNTENETAEQKEGEKKTMHCRVEIKDYPITFDDAFYFSFEVAKNIPVLCINASSSGAKTIESPYINSLFADSTFTLKNANENNLDYSSLANNKLIVLNELKIISSGLAQELIRFMNNGGSLTVFPNENTDLNSYKDFLSSVKANYFIGLDTSKTKVDKINMDDIIYKDVFDKKKFSSENINLPIVNKHFVLSKTTKSNEEDLLKLQNGDVFLAKYRVGKGMLYLSSVPLQSSFSNFVKHSIFVPTLYKIGIYSMNEAPIFYTLGIDDRIESTSLLKGENKYHVKSLNSNLDFIPELKMLDSKTEINIHHQIPKAGNFNLYSDKDILTGFSFNYNRKESELKCYNTEELTDQIEQDNINNIKILKIENGTLKERLSEMEQGKKLWKICVVLALLFLGAEVLLLRFMKG